MYLRSKLEQDGLPVANFIVEEPNGAMRLDDMAWYEVSALDERAQDIRSLVPAATALRKILKSREMACTTSGNILMFTAARQMNWEQAIKPALERGETVVTARSWLSTLAYQGYAEGGDTLGIERLTREFLGDEYMNPDFEVILDLEDEEERLRRLGKRDDTSQLDSFESRDGDFQTRITMGYRSIAAARGITLHKTASDERVEATHQAIRRAVDELFK